MSSTSQRYSWSTLLSLMETTDPQHKHYNSAMLPTSTDPPRMYHTMCSMTSSTVLLYKRCKPCRPSSTVPPYMTHTPTATPMMPDTTSPPHTRCTVTLPTSTSPPHATQLVEVVEPAGADLPAAQFVQAVPDVAYVPAGHVVQLEAYHDPAGHDVPAPHDEQVLADPLAYLPTTHIVQLLELAPDVDAVPPGQGVHAIPGNTQNKRRHEHQQHHRQRRQRFSTMQHAHLRCCTSQKHKSCNSPRTLTPPSMTSPPHKQYKPCPQWSRSRHRTDCSC
jgi:hypothetical protein